MEDSHNKEHLKDLTEHRQSDIEQNTGSKDEKEKENILFTRIINQLTKACKYQKNDDEGDYEDEDDTIKWKSLEKLLESHLNITKVFIDLAEKATL